MYLARKISRGKWTDEFLEDREIPADAISADLRTKSNTLSFWQCESQEDVAVDDVVLALAAGSERCSTIEVVLVEAEALRAAGVQLQATPGRTFVRELVEQHVDATRLDVVRLGHIARAIAVRVWPDDTLLVRRRTKRKVRSLLVDAVKSGRLQLADVDAGLRAELEPYLA